MAELDLDQRAITTIRTLAMDAVQAAQSGHPGTPMAMAPAAYCLWHRVLRFDPDDPIWPNRDRFVLSIGHASMLLYGLLHLTEVQAVDAEYERIGRPSVTLDDIRCFRQLDSRCPGHPEYRWTSGVETTTGPLGQGVATSVGMAVAARWQAARFNRPGFDLFDYDVYALCGDGCLMEGVASEAASLAGHLRLPNLCWIYDNNRITIEGATSLSFTEDVGARFLAYGWNVTRVSDANDLGMLDRAFAIFKHTADRPTLIVVDSHIAYGSPHKQDTSAAHGEPLGEDEIRSPGAGDLQADSPAGRNLHFGVREHAMGAILNGLSLSKIRPYGSGFLIFSDYGRPALRLSASMELPVICLFTHDSIGVGEDGPTHQPVEQLASLRAIPGLIALRPADANETVEAWRVIMPLRHQPVALVLSRQPLPTLDRRRFAPAAGLARGAYVLADAPDGRPDVLLLATGSEVTLCVEAWEQLGRDGIQARVVSMPSWELFEQQTAAYRDEVLPPAVEARVAVEQASTFGWERYVGAAGHIIGMRTFGASAPLKALQQKYGFTPERLVEEVKAQVARVRASRGDPGQGREGRS